MPEPNITSYIHISRSFAGRRSRSDQDLLGLLLGSSELGSVCPLAPKRREFVAPGKPLWSVGFAAAVPMERTLWWPRTRRSWMLWPQQGILIAVAPVVGTPRVMAAAGNIARALGLAVALADG